MAYEVTATRRRPRSFEQIVGQEFVVATLRGALERNRIAHAFLFSGPRGVGKTSAARILARALNCAHGPTATPCLKCNPCKEIASGSSLDVIEIDGASNTGVDDVRAIKDEVLFPPASAPYKVYIIDEVHMLSTSAFNALLKTVEEPPPHVVFIFATTEIHKVPATIRSRCQQFTFRLFTTDEICRRLAEVARELQLEADEEALIWIAKEADGSLRDAYTTFDQITSFTGGNRISIDAIRDTIGALSLDELNQIGELIGTDDGAAMLALADDIVARGVSVERFVVALADYVRSLLLLRHGVTRPGILGYPADRFSAAARSRLPVSRLELAAEMLFELHRNLKQSVNPRFELELLLSRLARVTGMVTPDELLTEVAAVKAQFRGDSTNGAPPPYRPQATADSGGGHGRAPDRAGGAGASKPGGAPAASRQSVDPRPEGAPSLPAGERIAAAAASRRESAASGSGRIAPRPPPEGARPGTRPAAAAAPSREGKEGSAPAASAGLLQEIGARVRGQKQLSLAASLERAVETTVAADRITVAFAATDRYSGEQVTKGQQTIATVASEILGRPVAVTVDYQRDRRPATASAAAATDEDVARFCKVFRGEVVKETTHGT